MKRGKKYVEAAKTIDRGTLYDVADAVSLVKKTATAKFDETIEAHIRTGCDGRHADQQIRGAVVLRWCLHWKVLQDVFPLMLLSYLQQLPVNVDIGNGYELLYGQLKEVPVKVGDYVEAKSVLGYVSQPTKYYSKEGCNVYFEMRKNGQPVNPVEYTADQD